MSYKQRAVYTFINSEDEHELSLMLKAEFPDLYFVPSGWDSGSLEENIYGDIADCPGPIINFWEANLFPEHEVVIAPNGQFSIRRFGSPLFQLYRSRRDGEFRQTGRFTSTTEKDNILQNEFVDRVWKIVGKPGKPRLFRVDEHAKGTVVRSYIVGKGARKEMDDGDVIQFRHGVADFNFRLEN